MKLSTKVAYNTIIQLAGKIISTIIGLFIIALITRYLGQTGFGQYTTVLTFLSFFAIFADLGLTLVTVQLISKAKSDDEENNILSNLLGLRLVSAIAFLGVGPLSVLFFPYEPAVKIGVLITAASFLFIALNQVFVGLFQKYLRMDKVSMAEVASRLALLLGVVLTIHYNGGLTGVLIATVAGSFISFLFHYLFSWQFAKIKIKFDLKYWKDIMVKSWPLALTIVFNLIYLRADALFLSLIKRPSSIGIIAEVGIYGAAYKVIDVLNTFPFMFAGIILPILTMRWIEKDKDGFRYILQKSFDWMLILALPMAIGTQFIARRIMLAIAGPEFLISGPVLQILIFASGIIFIGCMFSHAIIAIDKQKNIINAYIFTAITSLIGYFIFIPKYSYYGAAWVTIYSEFTIALLSAYLVYKYAGFMPKLNILIKSLIACALMAAYIYFIAPLIYDNLFFILASAGLIYFIVLYLAKGISKEDLFSLINK